ncbi:hypothetical protein H0R92_09555 [Treponema sp. OMZ 840]|uniref:DUF5312 family protein n=1 Tax=Treponema sp. OMZ 840 TaxID=244313 RepID=UPI003D8DF1BA
MDTNRNSFDRLVAGLDSDERASLLQKLELNIQDDKETLILKENEEPLTDISLEKELKSESPLIRFWIFLKGLFSNTGLEGAYNDYRIGLTVKKIINDQPNLIDPRHMNLENLFYERLVKLQEAAEFFNEGINIYEKDEGGFYVFLTMLVMPDFAERMEQEVSPYALSVSAEVTPELRTSLIRKMEQILADIGSAEKSKLHDCFSCLEWLKRFVYLPFSSFTSRFKIVPEKGACCSIKSVQTEITQFARILCNAKKMLPEVLQALYLFSAEEKMAQGQNISIEDGLPNFLQKSMQHITFIKYFITSIPMCALGAISLNSALWVPEYKETSETWLMRCKNQWRKIFDEQWMHWVHERKIMKTKENVALLFNITDYPFIPNRPWQTGRVALKLKKDYSLGLLYTFFSRIYPDFKPFLENVLVNGKFILPENKREFTDTYNEMNHLAEQLIAFNEKLTDAGIYGQAFAAITDAQTLQTQEKIKNFMRSVESEINLFMTVFSGCCRSFKQLFDGMFVDVRNIKYDGLSNLASLTDDKNVPIRSKLVEISDKIDAAFQLLKEVESMETEAP